jgi:hypothetical protein
MHSKQGRTVKNKHRDPVPLGVKGYSGVVREGTEIRLEACPSFLAKTKLVLPEQLRGGRVIAHDKKWQGSQATACGHQ